MRMFPRHFLFALVLTSGLTGRAAADDQVLPGLLPAQAVVALHVRSVPALRKAWQHTPFARTWADPEVQKFFAPGLQRFDKEAGEKVTAALQENLGLTAEETLDLFAGELAVALTPPGPDGAGGLQHLAWLCAAQLGEGGRAKVDTLWRKAAEKNRGKMEDSEEEFQGAALHTVFAVDTEAKSRTERFDWVIVDDILIAGASKWIVQQAVANRHRGSDAETLANSPDFAALLAQQNASQILGYVNLAAVLGLAFPPPKPQPAGTAPAPGLTPDVVVSGLGLDALRNLSLALEIAPEVTKVDFRLRWNERRGLLRALAYGPPPAPSPAFVSDTWLSASTSRFDVQAAYSALRDTLRTGLPIIDGMVQQKILTFDKQAGVHVERDLIGSLGNEITNAFAAPGSATAGAGPTGQPLDRLVAISVTDPAALRRFFDGLRNSNPSFAKSFVAREYLGETIYGFAPPSTPGAPPAQGSSYAITRTHFFFCTGSPAMLETALQGIAGHGRPLWNRDDVVAAFAELPADGSVREFHDMKRIVPLVFDLIAALPFGGPKPARAVPPPANRPTGEAASPDDPAGSAAKVPWDVAAKPSAAALQRHWSTAAGTVILEADGLHGVYRIKHAE